MELVRDPPQWRTVDPKLHPDTWPWPLEEIGRKVKEAWQLDRVDEIWLSHVDMTEARLAMEIFPRAKLIFYEDGICAPTRVWRKEWIKLATFPGEPAGPDPARESAGALASERVTVNSTPLHYFRRASGMYSFLNQAGDIPAPFDMLRLHMIDRERIIDAMEAAYDAWIWTAMSKPNRRLPTTRFCSWPSPLRA